MRQFKCREILWYIINQLPTFQNQSGIQYNFTLQYRGMERSFQFLSGMEVSFVYNQTFLIIVHAMIAWIFYSTQALDDHSFLCLCFFDMCFFWLRTKHSRIWELLKYNYFFCWQELHLFASMFLLQTFTFFGSYFMIFGFSAFLLTFSTLSKPFTTFASIFI